jgi:DNA invertase Pin-like site-specific DNA recombinase
VYREYVDQAGALDLRGRIQWRRLLDDATKGHFKCIVVLRLDRAFRSVADVHRKLATWEKLKVGFMSITEGWDTTSDTGRLLLNVLAAVAEFELSLTRTRVREGLARAKAQGKQLGRPLGSKDKKKRKKTGYQIRGLRRREAAGK